MFRIAYITFLLFLIGCDSVRNRFDWIQHTLDADQQSAHPSQAQIDIFFGFKPSWSHPYLNPQFQQELDQRTHSRLTAGNHVQLLPNNLSAQRKLELIQNAKKSIWIATFQIVCDAGGKQFKEALIKAANRGIEVRFLITGGPWTWAFSANCTGEMQETDIRVATMPYSYITNHGVVQLHDKIFLIDSEQAIVGGQNIGSWYSNKKKKEDSYFRDTDALISGPIVQDIMQRFINLWHLAKPNDRSLKIPDTHATPELYASWLKKAPIQGLCRFVSQTPSKKDFSVFEAYRLYASRAEQRIIFHSLTLNAFGSLEQEELWKSFVHVSQKPGAKVFFLTNGPGFISSEMMSPWVGKMVGYYFLNSVYDSLYGTPVETFVYPSWLHSKVYFFDNFATGIGSFNFDETGLVWTESATLCLDKNLAEASAQMFQKDLQDSYILQSP